MKRPAVLISAYVCEPGKGSEAAVGWNWALQMSRHYEVWVVTRRSRREAIKAYFSENEVNGIHFVYVDFPPSILRFKKGSLGRNVYYLLWQGLAFCRARRLVREKQIRLAHHVSFMSLTRGSFVPFLGIPSLIGPVGGLQTVSQAGLPLIRNRLAEAIRNFGARFFNLNPLGAIPAALADRLVMATGANLNFLSSACREKAVVGLQVGTEEAALRPWPGSGGTVCFRWIGRMVDHKGFVLLIDALEIFQERHPRLFGRLRVIVSGSGPEKKRCLALVRSKKLETAFEFAGWLSGEGMDQCWDRCHGFLFTSLRETTGLALLEAMMRGVPPVVVDNGGPGEIVTPDCGLKVGGETYKELVFHYAEAIFDIFENPEKWEQLGRAAHLRALSRYSWDAVGQQMHRLYQDILNQEFPSPPSR